MIIGMAKKSSPRIHYIFNCRSLDLMANQRRLSKRRGRSKFLAHANGMLNNEVSAKLVFIRDRRKKDRPALLPTDTELAEEDIVLIYGKRWEIMVFSR